MLQVLKRRAQHSIFIFPALLQKKTLFSEAVLHNLTSTKNFTKSEYKYVTNNSMELTLQKQRGAFAAPNFIL